MLCFNSMFIYGYKVCITCNNRRDVVFQASDIRELESLGHGAPGVPLGPGVGVHSLLVQLLRTMGLGPDKPVSEHAGMPTVKKGVIENPKVPRWVIYVGPIIQHMYRTL